MRELSSPASMSHFQPLVLLRWFLLALLATVSSPAGDWPQWRGPNRDGFSAPGETISTQAILEPKQLWKIKIGGGFSSPIVFSNRVIYLDENGSQEIAHMVNAADGKEIWNVAYAPVFEDEWGAGPRATPFSDGERIFVQSCNGEFRSLNFATGKTEWRLNFADYGVKFRGSKSNEGIASRRGNNGAGILDGSDVLVPVGSPDGATIVCMDKKSGAVKWKSGDDEAAYSSLMVADLANRRQVVMFTADALTGFDRGTGKVLWRAPLVTAAKRHAMTPVIHGNEIVVNSHTFGMICFEIQKQGDSFKAVKKWKNSQAKVNLCTPVWLGDALYSHGENKNFICVDASSGKLRWSTPGFGAQYSSVLCDGKNLLAITDFGEAVLIEPNPEKYNELARGQLVGKTWNHPALAEGKLIIRDQRSLTCFDAGK